MNSKKSRQKLFFFLILVCSSLLATSLIWGQSDTLPGKWIGPGVRYYSIIDSETPLATYVMEIDLSNPYLTLELGMSNDRLTGNEPARSIAERSNWKEHQIIGTINGDFWHTDGVPVGMAVRDGQLLRSAGSRSVFALGSDKRPFFDFFETKIRVTGSQGHALEFSDLNSFLTGNEPILFTPIRIKKITTPPGNYTIIMEPDIWEIQPHDSIKATVSKITDPEQTVELTESQFALVIPKEALSQIPEGFILGDTVKIEVDAQGQESKISNLLMAVGGGPRLLLNGEVAVDKWNETGEAFNINLHPRTAVGISKDEKTLYFVVVDGRRTGHSIGINLYNLAAKMKELGAYQAMNLDGGGSSTMVVRGETVNRPSDSGGDRAVSNCILLVSTAPPGPVKYLKIEPTSFEIFPKQTLALSITAQDTAYNPVEVPPALLQWEIQEGKGKIDLEGRFHAGRVPGNITLRARVEGVIGTGFTVLDTWAYGKIVLPQELRILPGEIALSPGEEITVRVEGLNRQGQWIPIDPEIIRWQLSKKNLGKFDQSTGLFSPQQEGQGTLKARFEGLIAEAKVVIGPKVIELLEDFSDLSDWNMTGVRIPMDQCRMQISEDQVVAGTRSLRLDYNLKGESGIAALYLNTLKTLYRQPVKIRYWVYGNECDHLLRMVMKDVDGERFVADAPGSITWRDEWKQIDVPFSSFSPHWGNAGAKPNAPYYLEQIYLVEPRTADKDQGTIYLDDIEVIYPPR